MDRSDLSRDAASASHISLNAAQTEVLAWIVNGCPDGVYPNDSFAHRITARALRSRGLVEISGHGASWRAVATERGRLWPAAAAADREEREAVRRRTTARIEGQTPQGAAEPDVVERALRHLPRRAHRKEPVPVRHVNKQESYMRYKVVVTRVQVAERWIRATDEEDAARKVREEFEKPYAYFGSWETKGSGIEIVEAEQTTVIRPSLLEESGPMLLTLKDAAGALGIPYSALNVLTSRGELECTRVGSRKYVSRESLMSFIKANTRRG